MLSKIFYFLFFIYFFSEANDSNDYLNLLNSIWNDHVIRSVKDINHFFDIDFLSLDSYSSIIYCS